MNAFLSDLSRFIVRVLLLLAGVVFFMSVLVAGVILAAVWGVRALWARLTGRPVMPWVMPTRAAATWSSMRQKAGGFAAQTRQAPPSKRSGVLPQVAVDVTDVQAREVP
ncbi:MAG: hypothetical protein KUL80_01255 [Comamonas sp.]|nr:hypothetical protein [Comamonas sp.]